MELTKQNEEKVYIESRLREQDTASIHQELISVLDHFYYTVSRVDLQADTVYFLQCAGHPEIVSQELDWTAYLKSASGIFVEKDRSAVLKGFSCAHLLELYQRGQTVFSMDALYLKNGELNGLQMQALLKSTEHGPVAYVMVRRASEDCLRKDIVDQYVYQSCDYFIYLDAKRDRYSIFSSVGTTPPALPPNQYNDYEMAMEAYVEEFVVPEDQKRVLQGVKLEYVLSRLEQQEVHSFTYGIMDPRRGYARKQLEYRYYERSSQTLLMSRTDVTDMYTEELAQREALAEALKLAHTDALTGLLNYQGIVENVSKALDQGVDHGALLFIDLDNFKSVNDSLGHLAGDRVLGEVASILHREAFGSPLVGRFGGDEFMVFFPHIHSIDDATAYARRVCAAVSGMQYGKKEEDPHISCSIGIVEVTKGERDYTRLTQQADEMAYQAKFTGKNRYAVYGAETSIE